MKFKQLFFLLLFMSIFLGGCEKKQDVEFSLLGEWKSEYEIMEDGSKSFSDPYAILEFEYSDGFILSENGNGNSIWFDQVNGDFKWTEIDLKLIMSRLDADNSMVAFEFEISNLTKQSMDFSTPKGHKYHLIRR